MEYRQLTIDDWLAMKDKLEKELQNVKHSFVRIGYALRKIDDGKLYTHGGYKSTAEFAQKEYGLESSTVSRFMAINREYSVDGYSETLLPEYEKFTRSQLEEMLSLPESDRSMIRPESPREDIRELKRFDKSGPQEGPSEIKELIFSFLDDNPEIMEDLKDCGESEVSETVNPSGTKTYRKGLFFMSMFVENIQIKKFMQDPVTISWAEFLSMAREKIPEPIDMPAPETEIAPAQKSEEISTFSEPQEEKNEALNEKKIEVPEEEIEEPQEIEVPQEVEAEISEPYGSRKDYLESLTEWGMAGEIIKAIRTNPGKTEEQLFWTGWLTEKVDDKGRTWIE